MGTVSPFNECLNFLKTMLIFGFSISFKVSDLTGCCASYLTEEEEM